MASVRKIVFFKYWKYGLEPLLMDALVSGQLYLQPPSQNPVLLTSRTNFVFFILLSGQAKL